MSKFTPGPWHVCSGNKKAGGICSCYTVSSDHHPIADIEHGEWGDSYPNIRLVADENSIGKVAQAFMDFSGYGSIPEGESVANANLIAAAPTGYSLLEEAVLHGISTDWVSRAKAYLEAVNGRS